MYLRLLSILMLSFVLISCVNVTPTPEEKKQLAGKELYLLVNDKKKVWFNNAISDLFLYSIGGFIGGVLGAATMGEDVKSVSIEPTKILAQKVYPIVLNRYSMVQSNNPKSRYVLEVNTLDLKFKNSLFSNKYALRYSSYVRLKDRVNNDDIMQIDCKYGIDKEEKALTKDEWKANDYLELKNELNRAINMCVDNIKSKLK